MNQNKAKETKIMMKIKTRENNTSLSKRSRRRHQKPEQGKQTKLTMKTILDVTNHGKANEPKQGIANKMRQNGPKLCIANQNQGSH